MFTQLTPSIDQSLESLLTQLNLLKSDPLKGLGSEAIIENITRKAIKLVQFYHDFPGENRQLPAVLAECASEFSSSISGSRTNWHRNQMEVLKECDMLMAEHCINYTFKNTFLRVTQPDQLLSIVNDPYLLEEAKLTLNQFFENLQAWFPQEQKIGAVLTAFYTAPDHPVVNQYFVLLSQELSLIPDHDLAVLQAISVNHIALGMLGTFECLAQAAGYQETGGHSFKKQKITHDPFTVNTSASNSSFIDIPLGNLSFGDIPLGNLPFGDILLGKTNPMVESENAGSEIRMRIRKFYDDVFYEHQFNNLPINSQVLNEAFVCLEMLFKAYRAKFVACSADVESSMKNIEQLLKKFNAFKVGLKFGFKLPLTKDSHHYKSIEFYEITSGQHYELTLNKNIVEGVKQCIVGLNALLTIYHAKIMNLDQNALKEIVDTLQEMGKNIAENLKLAEEQYSMIVTGRMQNNPFTFYQSTPNTQLNKLAESYELRCEDVPRNKKCLYVALATALIHQDHPAFQNLPIGRVANLLHEVVKEAEAKNPLLTLSELYQLNIVVLHSDDNQSSLYGTGHPDDFIVCLGREAKKNEKGDHYQALLPLDKNKQVPQVVLDLITAGPTVRTQYDSVSLK